MGVARSVTTRGPASLRTGTAVVMMVDDDPQLRVMLNYALGQEGFRVEEASSGEESLELLRHREPDIILLDVLMPGIGGVETCRRIRRRSNVPVIMLTALGRDEDIVAGLEAGADDYCTKPVSLVQLVARIRAQLRRRRMDTLPNSEPLTVDEGELVIDPAARQAIIKGRAIDLSPREFDLLHRLAQSPGRVVSHEELLEHVWGTTNPDYLAHLRSYIKLLRQKIEPDPHHPRYIRSRARMGYVLADQPREPDVADLPQPPGEVSPPESLTDQPAEPDAAGRSESLGELSSAESLADQRPEADASDLAAPGAVVPANELADQPREADASDLTTPGTVVPANELPDQPREADAAAP